MGMENYKKIKKIKKHIIKTDPIKIRLHKTSDYLLVIVPTVPKCVFVNAPKRVNNFRR